MRLLLSGFWLIILPGRSSDRSAGNGGRQPWTLFRIRFQILPNSTKPPIALAKQRWANTHTFNIIRIETNDPRAPCGRFTVTAGEGSSETNTLSWRMESRPPVFFGSGNLAFGLRKKEFSPRIASDERDSRERCNCFWSALARALKEMPWKFARNQKDPREKLSQLSNCHSCGGTQRKAYPKRDQQLEAMICTATKLYKMGNSRGRFKLFGRMDRAS